MSCRWRAAGHWPTARDRDILDAMVSPRVRSAHRAGPVAAAVARASAAVAYATAAVSGRLRLGPTGAMWERTWLAYTEIFVDDWGPRRWLRARIVSVLVLGFLSDPFHQIVRASWSVEHRALAVAGLVAFGLCFVTTVWRNTPTMHANRSPYTVSVGVILGVALFATGLNWLTGLCIYVMAMLLCNCGRRLWLPIVVAVPVAHVVLDQIASQRGIRDSIAVAVPVLLIGAVQAAFYQQIRAKVELARARTDLARLAVTEERLRISRDLHDILGQRLSALSLKAELAARLVGRDPGRAVNEMGEVADVARQALSDVRETVSGYRALTLAAEVETARALLSAAGLTVEVVYTGEALPEPVDECAGALVREAVTNVIRHASAKRCTIRIERDADMATVEVRNSSAVLATIATVSYGNGLTGLAERLASIGGTLWTGSERGDFVVRARIPLGQPAVVAALGCAVTVGGAPA
jgi:two-component system, NarL family, sensor histidine kinase DesK